MAYIVKIPKLGLTMTEATINTWCKSQGDKVKKEEVLFELSTDKLVNEVESEEDGVIRKILVEEGDTKPVLYPVAIIAMEDENIDDLLAQLENTYWDDENKEQEICEEKVEKVNNSNYENNSYILASPLAKKVAKERNIDLSKVSGTGIRNMITTKDLENIKGIKASPLAFKIINEHSVNPSDLNVDGRIMEEDVLAYINNLSSVNKPDIIKEKATSMRKAIAKNMSYSYSYSPRVTFNIDIDATQLKQTRAILKSSFENQGLRITYNHILMKVCAKALTEFKYMNAQFDGEEITIFPYVNLGIAVGLENGLVVPNIKNIESKNLSQISQETEIIIKKAKTLKVDTEDLTNGTFTITNIGNYGITSFTPIINQPEVAILGVNQMVDKPIAVNGEVVIKPILSLSLTADHRLIDGVYAAKFLSRIKELIENPLLLLA